MQPPFSSLKGSAPLPTLRFIASSSTRRRSLSATALTLPSSALMRASYCALSRSRSSSAWQAGKRDESEQQLSKEKLALRSSVQH